MERNGVIAVVGPTASGKTGLSVNIAKNIGGEVVSADSMQIYKDLIIGTARPDKEEMDGVEHHLMGHVNIDEHYSVADYVSDANKEIESILSKGKTPIICGGTGLYVDSLLSGTVFEEIKSDDSIRQKYLNIAKDYGNEKLHDLLKEKDPAAADKIHFNNVVRVVRALEVYDITGKSILDLQAESRLIPYNHDVLFLGLNYHSRQTLYEKINQRVDKMIDRGLLDEAEFVYLNKNAKTARQAIGYKEFFPYFKGEISFDEAIDTLKKETRHYAKRQLTWFLKNNNINWFYIDDYCRQDELICDVMKKVNDWRNNGE